MKNLSMSIFNSDATVTFVLAVLSFACGLYINVYAAIAIALISTLLLAIVRAENTIRTR
jgi:hypothetical protein